MRVRPPPCIQFKPGGVYHHVFTTAIYGTSMADGLSSRMNLVLRRLQFYCSRVEACVNVARLDKGVTGAPRNFCRRGTRYFLSSFRFLVGPSPELCSLCFRELRQFLLCPLTWAIPSVVHFDLAFFSSDRRRDRQPLEGRSPISVTLIQSIDQSIHQSFNQSTTQIKPFNH